MPEKSPGESPSVDKEAPETGPSSIRIPVEVAGIQTNFCRNPQCGNFARVPRQDVRRGSAKAGEEPFRDNYRKIGVGGKKAPPGSGLYCTLCKETASIKSNQGVVEELERISAYLTTKEPSCRTEGCENQNVSVWTGGRYHAHGKTPSGSPRWKCKFCGRVCSARKRDRVKGRSNENLTIFRTLVNKVSIRAMARISGLSTQSVYDKLDFIHRQCIAFVAEREREIPKRQIGRLWLSTDRQDYVVNWSTLLDRRHTQLTAVGTADNISGYVFGMHLNFDAGVVHDEIVNAAREAGDFEIRDSAYRRYARFWFAPDFEEAKVRKAARKEKALPFDPEASIVRKALEADEIIESAEDPEALEYLSRARKLPARGMQVRVEYTAHAHFQHLRRLLQRVNKIRFFIDQDDTLRAGAIAAFADLIKEARADVYYVKIEKELTIDEKRRLVSESKARFNRIRQDMKQPNVPDWRIKWLLLKRAIDALPPHLKWRHRWVEFPHSTLYEPEKAVCAASDRGDYDSGHQAAIMGRASLHGIDRFFMQVRRMLMFLERPIDTPSNANRTWRGYSPYNPAMVQKVLDIYRVYYNYCKESTSRRGPEGERIPAKTPATLIGLAKGTVRIEDILYFKPGNDRYSG